MFFLIKYILGVCKNNPCTWWCLGKALKEATGFEDKLWKIRPQETGCISQSSWHIPGSEAAHAAGPLCFLGCVFLWSPWLVRSPSLGRALRPYPSHLIRKAESGLRQQRHSPNFRSAFQVTCLLISTFLEERSKKKKKKWISSMYTYISPVS